MRKRVKSGKRKVVNSSLHPSKGVSVRRGEITLVYINGKKPYAKGEVIRIKKTSSYFKRMPFKGIERLSKRIGRYL